MNFNWSNKKKNGYTLKKAKSRWYPIETITDADYVDDLTFLANTPAEAESLEHSLEQAVIGIGLYVNSDKTEFMCCQLLVKWHNSEISRPVPIPW